MHQMEIVQYLKKMEFFSHLQNEHLLGLARIAEERHFDSQSTIVNEGQASNALFIIASGKVKVQRFNTKVAELGPFESFGEMSLLDGEGKCPTVTALSDVVLYQIPREPFIGLLQGNHDIAMGIIKVLTKRLRRVKTASATLDPIKPN